MFEIVEMDIVVYESINLFKSLHFLMVNTFCL